MSYRPLFHACGFAVLLLVPRAWSADLPWIRVSPDNRGFVLGETGKPFRPWGFNYDHDETGRLLEDYGDTEWDKVVADFREMKSLGANVVRIHLQTGKFLRGPAAANPAALARLGKLVTLAETTGLYLDLTGLGCYHKADVPDWYDALDEAGRWQAQATFWRAIAQTVADSPAVFCFDLMNEPVVPGGRRTDRDWLGPPFGGKHFVQVITLDQRDRPRPDIAKQWIHHLVKAIREIDGRHLVTVGLVDWSLDRPGLTSGFVPEKIAEELDFLMVHLYPEKGRVDEAIATLKGFQVGKPVVIEETFPLKCSLEEMEQFLDRSREHAAGVITFYWGKSPQELRKSSQFVDALMLKWLERFERRAKAAAE
jgi:hypothetical protein